MLPPYQVDVKCLIQDFRAITGPSSISQTPPRIGAGKGGPVWVSHTDQVRHKSGGGLKIGSWGNGVMGEEFLLNTPLPQPPGESHLIFQKRVDRTVVR